jgi:hypothetical protein
MLKTTGFLKNVEVDDFENGCDPDTSETSFDDTRFLGENEQDIINKIKEYYQVDDDALILNSCGESGRIDIQRMENAGGCQASKKEIEEWEKGKKTLYAAYISTNVEKISPFKFSKHLTIETE